MKPCQVDDVRHDIGPDAESPEDLLQKARRHDQCGSATQCGAHECRLLCEERLGIAAAIVDNDGNAAQPPHPDRGRGKQMPGPPGIRHDMKDVSAACAAKEAEQIGDQAKSGANNPQMADPCRPIRPIDLHDLDHESRFSEQSRELQRLIGHASRGWRQRPDKSNGDLRCRRHAPALPGPPPASN